MFLTGVCYDVEYATCSDLGFTRAGYPNLIEITPNSVGSFLTTFFAATVDRNCSVNAVDFGCALAYPSCEGDESVLLHPCRYLILLAPYLY